MSNDSTPIDYTPLTGDPEQDVDILLSIANPTALRDLARIIVDASVEDKLNSTADSEGAA
jgi:hypothetical protein